ncbi:histidinol-phosphate transaminase [uncultured Corynebacterium sp.]|uniref:histidinol-phosphate transaminase n=1 Tax=uncultured Corynebacterium sp. TaxID=159447 RepID=UPI0028D1DF72|nr:histidinol-phosphate transaminase [uncultured Corynebacterium sp.]
MVRADISEIPSYVPGKRLADALKLSSNEVAHPPLPAAVAAMAEAATTANRYPDMGATDLVHAIAKHLKLRPEQVAVGCGSSALCQQLVQITCKTGDEVVFPWRSFEAYPIFARVAGATPRSVPLTADHRVDLPALAAAITPATRLVFVCNPNNPTGTTITKREFEEFMAVVPPTTLVALDEAYFEFVRTQDTPMGTEVVVKHENVVALRTFSKAYGLAGVRVGYAFGNPAIIAALNKVAIPFGVSAVAQAGAIASLAGAAQLLERTNETVSERDRVARAIGAIPSEANFVWLPTKTAATLAQQLANQGVIIRAFPEGVRITVTDHAEANRFLAAWNSITQ